MPGDSAFKGGVDGHEQLVLVDVLLMPGGSLLKGRLRAF